MTYFIQNDIASSPSMISRVAQCAAQEGEPEPDVWTGNNRRKWAAAPGWDDAWVYAKETHPPVEGEQPYDPGADEAVITDAMILSQVQEMRGTAREPTPKETS
jgi:hypothetical protein